jgi:hypothetical protein
VVVVVAAVNRDLLVVLAVAERVVYTQVQALVPVLLILVAVVAVRLVDKALEMVALV